MMLKNPWMKFLTTVFISNRPVEREGLLLPPDKLKRFFFSKEDVPDGCADEYIIIPDKDADAIWAVCDTKDKGTDFESLPIAYQYGD